MADLTYRVVVDYATTGALAGGLGDAAGKAGNLAGALRSIGDVAASSAGGLADAFTGAVEQAGSLALTVGKLAGAAGIGAVTYGVVGLNNELEKSTIGIGAMLNAFGVSGDINAGMDMAGGLLEKMRKDAAALPGEFADLKQFFSLGLSPGLQAGASTDKLESMAANAMATAAALQVPMDQAAREYGMLLGGRAGAHNIFGAKLGLTGDSAKEFNAKSGGDRLEDLNQRLAKFQPAIAAYANSFEGLSSSMVDNLKHFLQLSTAPLFESVKGTLAGIDGWFDKNQDTVEYWAVVIGQYLANAWSIGTDQIQEWWPAIKEFAQNAFVELAMIWTKLEPIVMRVGESVQGFLSNPDAFAKIEDVLKAYAATKVGMAVLPSLGNAGSAIGGVGEAVGLSGPEGWAAAAVGLTALAAAMVPLYGAFDILTDDTNDLHDHAMNDLNAIVFDLTDSAGKLQDAMVPWEPAMREVADVMGGSLLNSLHSLAFVTDEVATTFDKASGKIASILGIQGADPKLKIDHGVQLGGSLVPMGEALGDGLVKAQNRRGAGAGGGGTHVAKVEIIVNGNQDANRTAELVVDKLVQIKRNPRVSGAVSNQSIPRT